MLIRPNFQINRRIRLSRLWMDKKAKKIQVVQCGLVTIHVNWLKIVKPENCMDLVLLTSGTGIVMNVIKGKKYSYAEYLSALHDGLLDSLIKEGLVDDSGFKKAGEQPKLIGTKNAMVHPELEALGVQVPPRTPRPSDAEQIIKAYRDWETNLIGYKRNRTTHS